MKKKPFRLTLFFLILLGSRCLVAQSLHSQQQVTAADYCDFLNHAAVVDVHHFYDDAMERDPAVACIVRMGEPGSYYYEVIAGRENFPVACLNKVDKEAYCALFHAGCFGIVNTTAEDLIKSNCDDFSVLIESTTSSLQMFEEPLAVAAELTWDDGVALLSAIAAFWFRDDVLSLREDRPNRNNVVEEKKQIKGPHGDDAFWPKHPPIYKFSMEGKSLSRKLRERSDSITLRERSDSITSNGVDAFSFGGSISSGQLSRGNSISDEVDHAFSSKSPIDFRPLGNEVSIYSSPALGGSSPSVGRVYKSRTPDLAMRYSAYSTQRNKIDARILEVSAQYGAIVGKNILEFGCGGGKIAIDLAEMGAKKVTGIDICPKMIGIAEATKLINGTQNVQFFVADGTDLRMPDGSKMPDGSQDTISSTFVIQHLPNKDLKLALGEMNRVLSPGGIVVATCNITDVLDEGLKHLYDTTMPIRLGGAGSDLVVNDLIKERAEMIQSIESNNFEIIHEEELEAPNAVIDPSFEYCDKLKKHAVIFVLRKK